MEFLLNIFYHRKPFSATKTRLKRAFLLSFFDFQSAFFEAESLLVGNPMEIQVKREVGESASAIISKMRCKKAANLLKTTDLPIGEISSFVGYADNNYFVKVFKKVYSMTPGDYRKK